MSLYSDHLADERRRELFSDVSNEDVGETDPREVSAEIPSTYTRDGVTYKVRYIVSRDDHDYAVLDISGIDPYESTPFGGQCEGSLSTLVKCRLGPFPCPQPLSSTEISGTRAYVAHTDIRCVSALQPVYASQRHFTCGPDLCVTNMFLPHQLGSFTVD